MSWSATTGPVGAGGADAAAAFPVRRGTALCRPQYRLSERRRGCTPPRNPSVILAPRPGLEPGTYGLTGRGTAPLGLSQVDDPQGVLAAGALGRSRTEPVPRPGGRPSPRR